MRTANLPNLVARLIDSAFVFESRGVDAVRRGYETWVEIGSTGPLDGSQLLLENSAAHYLETIRQGRISLLLFDASLVQVSYRFRGDALTFHRYCYIPAPVRLDLRAGAYDGGDWLEEITEAKCFTESRRSALRFEYDPDAAENGAHPAAHLHVNSPRCRVPLRAPLLFNEFVGFLIRHFYSDQFNPQICGILRFDQNPSITALEESGFHVNWRRFVAPAA